LRFFAFSSCPACLLFERKIIVNLPVVYVWVVIALPTLTDRQRERGRIRQREGGRGRQKGGGRKGEEEEGMKERWRERSDGREGGGEGR